ncbi:MAG: hypothetical protein JXA46_13415 [Dehalococcoidales bacterium]|nr:hypothetical protein [Dehalococcoidales bacterium]
MNANISEKARTMVVLILALVALILYVLSIYFAFPVLQQTWISDSMAEYHSLPPIFFIAVGLAACLCCYCLIVKIRNRYLLAGLLILLAVMLWLTPYCLSSFVRFTDSTWHAGIAMKMPQVIAGDQVAFTKYGVNYPAGYIFHYSVVSLLGIEPMSYIKVFPLVSLILFILGCFLVISRLFNRRVAFLAMLVAIPCLHYIQIHTSPHALGAVMMLCAFLLIILRGFYSRLLGLLLIIAVIFTHPTTPFLIMIFLAAAIVMLVITERKIKRFHLVLGVFLIATFLGWFFLYSDSVNTRVDSTQNVTSTASVQKTASNIKKNVTPEKMSTGREYIQGNQYIFKNIYNLNKGIYFLLAAAALLGIILELTVNLVRKKNFKKWIRGIGNFKPGETLLIIAIPLLGVLTLLLAEMAHDLIETGLTYIILCLACITGSLILRWNWLKRILPKLALSAGVLFMVLTFPLVIYGIDAYSSPPLSEEYGLKFIAYTTPINGKSMGGNFITQLALYLPSSVQKVSTHTRNLDTMRPDVAIFRHSGYYYQSMRFALSFEDNAYTRSLAMVEDLKYTKVYSSSTVKIFLKKPHGRLPTNE